MARKGNTRHCMTRKGMEWKGNACHGKAWYGMKRQGNTRVGMTRQGITWKVKAWNGIT
jgi:hypothetical protein